MCWAVSGALLIRPLTGVPCFATGVCFSTAGSVSDGTGSGCEGSLHMGSSHKSNPSVVLSGFVLWVLLQLWRPGVESWVKHEDWMERKQPG